MTYKNTFQQGVRQIDRDDAVLLGDGVPITQGIPWRSQEDIDLQQEYTGIPMMAPAVEAAGDPHTLPVAWILAHADPAKLAIAQANDNEGLTTSMKGDQPIAPIHVIVDPMGFVELLDGYHRVLVADSLGWDTIEATVNGELPKDLKPARVQCAAETKKGNPCKGWAVGTGLFCMVHDIG